MNSTSSSFSTSTSYDNSASFDSESPPGFTGYQPFPAGSLQDGWAQKNETDTANGSKQSGVVNASFTNQASETATSTFFTTTNTAPGSAGPLYQEWTSRSMTTWTSETGNYTTSPPGSAAITPTPDNPGGYATFNETRDDSAVVTNSATVVWIATATQTGSTESANMTYNGWADSGYTSHKVMSAAPANPAGSESGSYTATGGKGEYSHIQ